GRAAKGDAGGAGSALPASVARARPRQQEHVPARDQTSPLPERQPPAARARNKTLAETVATRRGARMTRQELERKLASDPRFKLARDDAGIVIAGARDLSIVDKSTKEKSKEG